MIDSYGEQLNVYKNNIFIFIYNLTIIISAVSIEFKDAE